VGTRIGRQAWLKISDESLHFFVECLRQQWLDKKPNSRSKVRKAELEDWLHLYALAYNLYQEVKEVAPVGEELLVKAP